MWLNVWSRALLLPALRRAAGLWVGAGIVAAVLFGPTGLQPKDVTDLALHNPGAAAVLGGTWLLLFVPIARPVVRADAVAYLRALPGPGGVSRVLAALALVGLQLPWVVLWCWGARGLGVAVVAASTAVIAGVAAVRLRTRAISPRRMSLAGVHVRALRRRGGDALARAAGVAILGGVMAGLLATNNDMHGGDAAVLGGATLAIALVPALAGAVVVVAESHRASSWLALASGASETARALAAMAAVVGIALIAVAIACGSALLLEPAADVAALAPVAAGIGAAAALAATRVVVVHASSPALFGRVVASGCVTAALGVLALGVLGVTGVIAELAAVGILATRKVRA